MTKTCIGSHQVEMAQELGWKLWNNTMVLGSITQSFPRSRTSHTIRSFVSHRQIEHDEVTKYLSLPLPISRDGVVVCKKTLSR